MALAGARAVQEGLARELRAILAEDVLRELGQDYAAPRGKVHDD